MTAIAGGPTVIWMDVLVLQLLANFVFDCLLLWATAEVTRAATTRLRVVGAATLGTTYFLLYLLAQAGLVPVYGVLRWIPVVLLVSVLMLLVAFGPLRLRRMLVVAAHFYGVGFVAAGAGTAASFLIGSPAQPDALAGFLAASGVILLVAEVGWGVVQRRVWQQLYHMPLEVRFGQQVCRMQALVDTGNRLRDPLSDVPVVVVEGAMVRRLLPDYLQAAVAGMESGDLTEISRLLASEQWSSRFRVIPFASIGREHGLLVGFRPDEVRVVVDGRSLSVGPCILGLCQGPLDPDGAYHALIHPDLVQPSPVAARPSPSLVTGRAPSADATRRL